MERPKIEDFEIESHDCWGVTEFKTDWVSYAQALEKYIESTQPHLPLGDVSGSVCGIHSTDWYGKCFKCGEQVFNRNYDNKQTDH